jgi:predicted enzyme related to lactoylglutathione lyase
MTKVEYQTEIISPIEKVYEYYTNPDNIQEAWPRDIVKESECIGISGALTQKENPQQLSTQFVRVESTEDYKSKAKQLGASVVKDKQEISEGYYAVLVDPQKNSIGIWQEK